MANPKAYAGCLIRARWGLLLKPPCPSHECALSLRYFGFCAIDSGDERT
jgi:hypothetical protein